MSDAKDAETRGFTQGVAWAVSILSRYPLGAGGLLNESGLNYSDFKKAKVVASDLAEIRKVMKIESMEIK